MPHLTTFLSALGIAAALFVLSRAIKVKLRVSTGASFKDLREVAKAVHACVGEYMKANYSGDPAQLPAAVIGLVPRARAAAAAAQGMKPLDDDMLHTLLVVSLAAHHCGTRDQADAAVEQALKNRPIAA